MSPRSAALVVALRPAVERLVERAAAEPDSALDFTPTEQKVVNCLRALCLMNAGDYNIQRESATPVTSRPDGAKRGNTRGWGTNGPRGGFGGGGYGSQGGFGSNQGGFGGNQGFGGSRGGGFGSSRGGFGGNRGGFGGNQGGFGGNQGGFGGGNGYGNRGRGFGRGGRGRGYW